MKIELRTIMVRNREQYHSLSSWNICFWWVRRPGAALTLSLLLPENWQRDMVLSTWISTMTEADPERDTARNHLTGTKKWLKATERRCKWSGRKTGEDRYWNNNQSHFLTEAFAFTGHLLDFRGIRTESWATFETIEDRGIAQNSRCTLLIKEFAPVFMIGI